jgi:hypothetical protein
MTSPDPRPGGDVHPGTALDRLDPVHRRIATTALRAAARYGFSRSAAAMPCSPTRSSTGLPWT